MAALLVLILVLLVYLDIKIHPVSKQNAREHAELRAASNRQAEEIAGVRQELTGVRQEIGEVRQEVAGQAKEIAGVRQEMDRQRESTDRRFDATDRRFDSIDRKLDQILTYLLKNHSDNDD